MSEQLSPRLIDLERNPVNPPSAKAAKSVLADLKSLAGEHEVIADLVASDTPARAFILAALSLSPYLRELSLADPEALGAAIVRPLAEILDTARARMRGAWRNDDGEPVPEPMLMSVLRQAKRRAVLALALHDLARLSDGRKTTAGLTALADAALGSSFDHLLRSGHDAGKLKLADPENPGRGSGLIVLAMGKHGAGELNFSSDIDIVVFFEPRAGIVLEADDATETFARLVRRLVRIMQERTGDGYVFRTDLRLRPDPGSTPLAFPVDAAINYYESRGQNWERAAYIKARAVAGDMAAGEAFLSELTPFVYRKYLDFAAIADIHSIKRQIHAHRGFGGISVKGHNVKLGRGGIREIEFFVQTQQLIAGGRMPQLRKRRTDEMLVALARARWIDPATARTLADAYWYLRDIEHRIQMVHDEQSHTLPETETELTRIALMAGEKDSRAFGATLVEKLKAVERCYADLFEKEQGLSLETGNLVFTGDADDPATLATLSSLGFERPEAVSAIIRTWHYGRYRATRSAEARERLTELTPTLLKVFGKTRQADEALIRFDSFISGLPAGIQLFSLLGTNPALMSLMVTIMASAPRLADLIARRPHVFDGMLDPALMAELPTRKYLSERIDAFLEGADAHEEILDRLRVVAAEQKFLIGVRLLTGAITGIRAGEAFTDLADLIIGAALQAVQAEMESAHGRISGGRVAVIGMGKLGSCELTAGSDVDIILIYDHEGVLPDSDGPRPLDSNRYYARLTQRLIAALSAPTAEGVLYEVDLRLRPSGNKGPVATSVASFRKYQAGEAWTWERMALTRARSVAGDPVFCGEVSGFIDEALARPQGEAKVLADLVEMRSLIDKEKPPKDFWDVKLIPGGLIDIEFIAQFLSLKARAAGWSPDGACTGTVEVLARLGPEEAGVETTQTLLHAHHLWSNHSQMVRLCIEGAFEPANAPAGLIDLVVRAGEAPDLKALEAEMKSTSRQIRQLFRVLTSGKS